MQTGEPAHPVQFSLMIARISGFFLRGAVVPADFGSILIRSKGSVVAMPRLSHSLLGGFKSFPAQPSVEGPCAVEIPERADV